VIGLTVGTHYQVQFVLADSRAENVGRTITITGAAGVTGSSPTIQYAYGDGRYAILMADFIADVDRVAFRPLVNGGTNGIQVNAVQVLSVESSFTLTYSGNGNSAGNAPVDANSPYSSLAVVTVLGNTGGLAKAGQNFAGWNTAANGSGGAYVPSATFIISSNTVLYAQWVSGYPVIYEGNGSTAGVAPRDPASPYAGGATVTVLNQGTLAKAGYTFVGWNTVADGSGTARTADSTFSINEPHTLYAQWSINHYTITYHASGGGSLEGETSQTVIYGGTATEVTAVSAPGYHFAYWSDGVKKANRTDANVSKDSTVTAFFSKDALAPGDVQVEYTLGEDGSADWVSNLQTDASGHNRILLEGEGAAKWTGSASATAQGSAASWMVVDGESAHTLSNAAGMATNYQVSIFQESAHWGPNPTSEQYLLAIDGVSLTRTGIYTFNARAGTNIIGSFTAPGDWVKFGMMIQKANGVFSFWISLDGGTTWNQQGSDVYAPGLGVNWEDTTLFAKPGGGGSNFAGYVDEFLVQAVTPPPSALTYDGNGSTGGSVPTDTKSPYVYGTPVTALGQGTLVKAGYQFLGWNTSANAGGTLYHSGDTFRITGDTILYAQWTSNDRPVLQWSVLNGHQLKLEWTGIAILQVQTNSPGVGLTATWLDNAATSPVTVPTDTTKGSVFFRLKQ
jgi:uncharacterized repeat protein (TIGR02543 family)